MSISAGSALLGALRIAMQRSNATNLGSIFIVLPEWAREVLQLDWALSCHASFRHKAALNLNSA